MEFQQIAGNPATIAGERVTNRVYLLSRTERLSNSTRSPSC